MVGINFSQRCCALLLFGLVLFGGSVGASSANALETGAAGEPTRLIIQGRDLHAAKAAVRNAGGEISAELKIIRAVVAELSSAQRERVESDTGVQRVWVDVATHAPVSQPD